MKTIWKFLLGLLEKPEPPMPVQERLRPEQITLVVEEMTSLNDQELLAEWRRMLEARDCWSAQFLGCCLVASARWSGMMNRERQRAELRELIARN